MGFGYNEFDTGFGMGFQLFDVMFFLIFFLILGMFLFMIVKGLSTWNKNNQSPRLTVDATVVAKRTDVTHHHNGDNMATHSTWYYATFQVESGDRDGVCCRWNGIRNVGRRRYREIKLSGNEIYCHLSGKGYLTKNE